MNSISPQMATGRAPKAKILFVDDEERIVRLLTMIFRGIYTVFTATSGTAALEIINKEHIHVIVSDQRMPEMTGIQLLAEVRKVSPTTIRLLLTGYSDLVAIIGAVNEGEVYRFLNKPWDQTELKATIAETASIALAAEQVPPPDLTVLAAIESPPLATAAKLLALDGVDSNRLEIMEMFTEDYSVLGASTVAEAETILMQHDVGVVITDSKVGGEDTSELLKKLNKSRPWVTTIVMSSVADSETIIKLINESRIYRFAMKPLAPNIFRLAVAAAMKEHHRRLIDPRLTPARNDRSGGQDTGNGLADGIFTSLSRFTKVW